MDNRYYLTTSDFTITGQEANHLIKVRRAKVGDEIVAFNGDGYDYRLIIEKINKDNVSCRLKEKTKNISTDECDITVYLAMLKNDAMSTAIDHLAEMNVKTVKLFKSDFSVANFDTKKLEKLLNISIQASKQCERADVMQIEIIDKSAICEDINKYKNRFFAYENSNSRVADFVGDFAVIIGPEGGFSPSEAEYFSQIAVPISLGKTILRAEVACVSSVATLKAVNHAC